MKDHLYASADVDLSRLIPIGDFVLVKRMEDDPKVGRLFAPASVLNPREGLRRGVVVAAGPGDRPVSCLQCLDGPEHCTCRHAMNIRVGDEVIYPRVPANDVRINGEIFTMCHEEQHILAVLERSDIVGVEVEAA